MLCIRTVSRIAGRRLVLFILVGDHLHVIVLCGDADVGRIRRALELGLRAICDRPLAPPRTRRVEDRRHLDNSVGYLLNQTKRHRIATHPALWSGSCFADLVGARRIPNIHLAIFELLPRLNVSDVYGSVGLEPPALPTADEVRAVSASRLVTAAHAALGVVPGTSTPRGDCHLARQAGAWIGHRAGIARSELRWALGCSSRTLQRLIAQPPPVDVQRATLLQLALAEAASTPVVLPFAG